MEYTVWVEGYMATGEHGRAHCLGTIEAEDFNKAAYKLWLQVYKPAYEGCPYTAADYFSINERTGRHQIWGCNCYDNEEDARKSFG